MLFQAVLFGTFYFALPIVDCQAIIGERSKSLINIETDLGLKIKELLQSEFLFYRQKWEKLEIELEEMKRRLDNGEMKWKNMERSFLKMKAHLCNLKNDTLIHLENETLTCKSELFGDKGGFESDSVLLPERLTLLEFRLESLENQTVEIDDLFKSYDHDTEEPVSSIISDLWEYKNLSMSLQTDLENDTHTIRHLVQELSIELKTYQNNSDEKQKSIKRELDEVKEGLRSEISLYLNQTRNVLEINAVKSTVESIRNQTKENKKRLENELLYTQERIDSIVSDFNNKTLEMLSRVTDVEARLATYENSSQEKQKDIENKPKEQKECVKFENCKFPVYLNQSGLSGEIGDIDSCVSLFETFRNTSLNRQDVLLTALCKITNRLTDLENYLLTNKNQSDESKKMLNEGIRELKQNLDRLRIELNVLKEAGKQTEPMKNSMYIIKLYIPSQNKY